MCIERHCELLQLCSVYMWNSFWDWEKGERLDYFYNGNPRYTRITAMEYLNGHDCSLLLTATGQFTYHSCWSTLWSVLMFVSFYADLHHATFCADDGALRIWKNFADQRNPEMVTAWQGLSDMLPTTRGLLSHSYTLCANTALLLSSEFLFPRLLSTRPVFGKSCRNFQSSCMTRDCRDAHGCSGTKAECWSLH